ncbi:MAG TPA: DNA primase [Burkholderiales bacterium]|nr:DNA primase [Burkholderiales bacterium]
MIPDSFKQDLLNRVDIVDVISGRVPLKKSGANWVGLCPFHGEKTPSFSVSQTKQFYHCFGCGAHGNAIGFLMEYAGLGYVEAVRELAESVGMKLPELRSEERTRKDAPEGPDLYELLANAARFYREQLKASPRAIDYLKGRGLTGKTAARFGIGYAPAGWQNLAPVFTDYGDKALVQCGLVVENEGKRYDRFRDRVIFPILNQRGIVIGFGGRVIDGDDGPKYLNSPETPVFEKGRELYGLPQARDGIRAANRVVVVEGYMDVVMLAQHGVENAVATLGTATTLTHAQKLLRQADEVVFCFDGDAAGRRAAWHALEVSLEALSDRKAIRFLFLPAEHDPDSYVREFGREGFEREVAAAQPLSAFLLSNLTARGDLSTLEGRSRLIAEAKPLVRRLAAPALRLQLLNAIADAAAMTAGEVARLMELRDGTIRTTDRPVPVREDRAAAVRSSEAKLLRALLAAPELAATVPVELLPPAGLEASALRALVERLGTSAGGVVPRPVSTAFEGAPFYGLMTRLEADLLEFRLEAEDLRAELEGAVRNLEHQAKAREIKDMLARKEKAGLPERLREGAALRQPAPALQTGGVTPTKAL